MFSRKWSHIVSGDDGELARDSRWWKAFGGERVTEMSLLFDSLNWYARGDGTLMQSSR